MSTRTSYLNLVLPELNEFINSWNAPVNQNMEAVDDFADDLHESLVGSSATSTWATLRGSMPSLADRLDVSINADGTIDLSASPDLLAIAASAYTGQYTTPVDRLNATDDSIYGASLPATGDRFTPMAPTGPSAGFPHSDLESGIAIRSAHFSVSGEQGGSPHLANAWAPGLVAGGGGTFITGISVGKVQFNGLAAPAIFNIDGHIFRLREDITLDYQTIVPAPVIGEYVWFYIDRNQAGYNDATFRYGASLAPKDLRVLQAGAGTGATSGSVFQATGATFSTAAIGKVKSGDILVIESGSAAGEYVIDALDGLTPDTKLTIKGVFKDDVSGISWHVQDDWHPNIGAVATGPLASTRPAFVAGRVYIGRAIHQAGVPTQIVTFTAGGVYDSGWITPTFPQTLPHNLGALPGSVDVWVRESAVTNAYRPLVRRAVMTNLTITGVAPVSGDRKYATFLMPSLFVHTNEVSVITDLLNASTDPAVPVAYFTDSAGVDKVVGQIRIIARK